MKKIFIVKFYRKSEPRYFIACSISDVLRIIKQGDKFKCKEPYSIELFSEDCEEDGLNNN